MRKYDRGLKRGEQLLAGATRPTGPTRVEKRTPEIEAEFVADLVAAYRASKRLEKARLEREDEERIRDFGALEMSAPWTRFDPAMFLGQPLEPVPPDPGWPVDDTAD